MNVGRPIKNIPNIICPCGYEWFTKSKLEYVCCPNCNRKCFNKSRESSNVD